MSTNRLVTKMTSQTRDVNIRECSHNQFQLLTSAKVRVKYIKIIILALQMNNVNENNSSQIV